MIVISEYGNEYLLNRFIKGDLSYLELKLYSNKIKINKGLDTSDFIQVVGFGYLPIKLYPALWQFNKNSIMINSEFIFTGNVGNVYGYYITNDSGNWIWAEEFDKPYEVKVNEDKIQVINTISIKVKGI